MNTRMNRLLLACVASVCSLTLLGCDPGEPELSDGKRSYIVAYITKLQFAEDGDGWPHGDGELAVSIAAAIEKADGSILRQANGFPPHNWHLLGDGEDILDWPDPFSDAWDEPLSENPPQLNLPGQFSPWAIPILAIPEDELGNKLSFTLLAGESDETGDIGKAAIDISRGISDRAAELLDKSGTVEGFVAARGAELWGEFADIWLGFFRPDKLAAYEYTISKAELLEIVDSGRIPDSDQEIGVDVPAFIEWTFRRVQVPCDVSVAARLVAVTPMRIEDCLDSSDCVPGCDCPGEIYVASRAWGGEMFGSDQDETLLSIPASAPNGSKYLDEWQEWRPANEGDDNLIWNPFPPANHKLGPFLSLNVGVWDQDDNEDDTLGHLYGLWLTDQLVRELQFEPDKKIAFVTGRSSSDGSTQLAIEFELVDGGGSGLTAQVPKVGKADVCLYETLAVCTRITNSCQDPLSARASLYVDGVEVEAPFHVTSIWGKLQYEAGEEFEVPGGFPGQDFANVCFDHTFDDPSQIGSHTLRISGSTDVAEVTVTSCMRFDAPFDCPIGTDNVTITFDQGVTPGEEIDSQFGAMGLEVLRSPWDSSTGSGLPVVTRLANVGPPSGRNFLALTRDSEDCCVGRRIRLAFPGGGIRAFGAWFGGGTIDPDGDVSNVRLTGVNIDEDGQLQIVAQDTRIVGPSLSQYFLGFGNVDERMDAVVIEYRVGAGLYDEAWWMDDLQFCLEAPLPDIPDVDALSLDITTSNILDIPGDDFEPPSLP